MLGLVIGALWIAVLVATGTNLPLSMQSASNIMFYWYCVWAVIGIVILFGATGILGLAAGIGTGSKCNTAVGGLAAGTAAATGVGLLGLFAAFFGMLGSSLWIIGSYFIYYAIPSNATQLSDMDQTKSIVAGILFAVAILLQMRSRTYTTSSSKKD